MESDELPPYRFTSYEDIPRAIEEVKKCQVERTLRNLIIMECIRAANEYAKTANEEQMECLIEYIDAVFELNPKRVFTRKEFRLFTQGKGYHHWFLNMCVIDLEY